VRIVAFIAAGLLALVGLVFILGSLTSEAGLGPLELVIGLIPLVLAFLLMQLARR
jgi:hypothetical protein